MWNKRPIEFGYAPPIIGSSTAEVLDRAVTEQYRQETKDIQISTWKTKYQTMTLIAGTITLLWGISYWNSKR